MRGVAEPRGSSVEQRLWEAARSIFSRPEDQARFVALAYQESGFDPDAHNRRGEDSYGLFQFGPELRRAYGLEVGSPVEAQIAAGADYIRRLYEKHGGRWTDVFAEHNLGLPRYRRMRSGAVDPAIERFWLQHLPAVERAALRFAESASKGAGSASSSVTSAATSSATSPVSSGSNGRGEGFVWGDRKKRPLSRTGVSGDVRDPLDRLGSLLALLGRTGSRGVRLPPIVEVLWLLGRRDAAS